MGQVKHMTDPVQALIGVKLSHLLAGLAGGVVRALLRPGVTMLGSITAAITGTITAAYLTPLVVYHFGQWGWLPSLAEQAIQMEHAVGFIVGLTGMTICEGIIGLVQRWRENPQVPPVR